MFRDRPAVSTPPGRVPSEAGLHHIRFPAEPSLPGSDDSGRDGRTVEEGAAGLQNSVNSFRGLAMSWHVTQPAQSGEGSGKRRLDIWRNCVCFSKLLK